MSADPGNPFPLTGALPSGRAVIEASAGTGKTFTLASLATRFIAEQGIPPSELLMVTFTRAATGELRSRVRDQLTAAAAVLAGEAGPPEHDPLMLHLSGADRDRRLERLKRGITEFDAATIITIHGFAAQVRGTLGLSAAVDPDARLVGDIDEEVRQACADVLAGAAAGDTGAGVLPRLSVLITATREAVSRPDVVLEPHSAAQGAAPALVELNHLVRTSVATLTARRWKEGTLSFDDVLIQLRDALLGDQGPAVVEALRSRFTVALIDEFQDTDGVQWDIFKTLFGAPGSGTTLVLVGDPKQAIYRFRGADIHTYLDAVSGDPGTERYSLVTNWRSDGAVLRSLEAVFGGATFGDPGIGYQPVAAAPDHQHRRLRIPGGDPLPALVLRLAIGPDIARLASGQVNTPQAETSVNHDLVAYLRDQLGRVELPGDQDRPARPLRPSDVAVLVGSGQQAEAVQWALRRQGVPAVVAAEGSVLGSPAATHVRLLFEAMTRPADSRAVRAFALSWFVGATADEVAAMDDERLMPLQEQLAEWASFLLGHPVADVLAQVWKDTGVVARVLGAPDGDRNLTDLDHLAELLHGKTPRGTSGTAALLAVLDAAFEDDVDTDVEGSVAARRIESEADAVQIMTIWKAKGLEFPVVCVPTLWHYPKAPEAMVYSDPSTGRRTCDLAKGKDWPDKKQAAARKALADLEVAGEHLRLLYVALTRARHQTVVWWGNGQNSSKTALARILFARTDGAIDPAAYAAGRAVVPADDDIVDVLAALAERSGGTMSITPITHHPAPPVLWHDAGPDAHPGPLGLARFDVDLDRSVQRWSFSSITNRGAVAGFDPFDWSLSDAGAGDERGEEDQGDEREAADRVAAIPGEERLDRPDGVGLLASLPAGTAFGTLVHSVLEQADVASPVLGDELSAVLERQLAGSAVDLTPVTDPDEAGPSGQELLVAGLAAAIVTPWGRRLDGLCLAALDRADRLSEVSFDLRVGQHGRHPSARDIGRLVVDHLDAGDPLVPWAGALAGGSIDVALAGYLTGSIDLVARVHGVDATPRFVVADYKTNQLTPRGAVPGPDDYRQERLATAMAEHHYPLQALLYATALHRYLRWRLRGYRPAVHLAGAAYLFVRGMTGAATAAGDGPPGGVFDWAIPPSLVVAISDLLDGRAPLAARA